MRTEREKLVEVSLWEYVGNGGGLGGKSILD